MKHITYLLIFFLTIIFASCSNSSSSTHNNNDTIKESTIVDNLDIKEVETEKVATKEIIVGAKQLDLYISELKNKKIALVVNQTSMVDNTHLVDTLISLGITIKKIFAVEHGFRGNIDRGKHIDSNVDEKTGLPIVAIFGKSRRPSKEQLSDVDIVIFDIQDVGARFYTYISSMHEVMEACAANNKKIFVLDRPNPTGDYVDGPVREANFKSFVGMHAIPIVHGLTVGELAKMINGEGWLTNNRTCDLTVIPVKNYNHAMLYSLPIKPSPNLPNDISIRLYPSLCLFEATKFSIGRGTDFPFQVIGYPDSIFGNFSFIPRDIVGGQTNPLQEGKTCFGVDLRNEPIETKFTLKYIIEFYQKSKMQDAFFSNSNWFNKLVGNAVLQEQIKQGLGEEEIRKSWQPELNSYKKMREKYLIYK